MENTANAMACVGAYNRIAVRLNRVRDNVTDFAVHFVWSTIFDRGHKTLIGLLDEGSARLGHFANQVCLIQIAMETILVGCHVEVDNITVLQRSRIGNTMADDLID